MFIKTTETRDDLLIAATFWDFYRKLNKKIENYTGETNAFNWSEDSELTCVFIEELKEIATYENHSLQYIAINAIVDALKHEAPVFIAEADLDSQTLVARHHLLGFRQCSHHLNLSPLNLSGEVTQENAAKPEAEKKEGGQEKHNIPNIFPIINKNLLKTDTYRDR